MNKEGLISKIDHSTAAILDIVGRIREDQFMVSKNDKWSVAENMAHLTLSAKLMNKALKMPKIALLLRFGPNFKKYRGLEWMNKTYSEATLPKVTGFEPRMHPDSSKVYEIKDFIAKHDELKENSADWSDFYLDKVRLPHLAFKYLSVREYLQFMSFHIDYHKKAILRQIED
ncbi:DinB family protein [Jiulongibacter sp. NS-SX5]|uniref:DinB family protein n=1 Tax=Jiulongibacter sp. NS-SX5 TaxID=3463854 RepID=UPI004057F9BC